MSRRAFVKAEGPHRGLAADMGQGAEAFRLYARKALPRLGYLTISADELLHAGQVLDVEGLPEPMRVLRPATDEECAECAAFEDEIGAVHAGVFRYIVHAD